jgi:hypothetical protein
MAIFGWKTLSQAEVYTRAVERARLGAQAMHKLDESGTSMPAPTATVRVAIQKP